jgi:hypothetical protein
MIEFWFCRLSLSGKRENYLTLNPHLRVLRWENILTLFETSGFSYTNPIW